MLHPDARIGIMGAGSDDLDSGRAYLTALAEGGYVVPTWPKEHGGMGVTQAEAGAVRAALAAFRARTCTRFSWAST